jgi:molybdopterin-containing oxidoreductase family iron-sulfur binding subunit
MHWIRIDTYWRGDAHAAEGPYFQPMMCQHCETAPCEVVCPVAATTHSAEGINEMTYNRCVGTRYCSNNCPYKVRRFNFLLVAETAPAFQMMHNPDVTVRQRGVMEKCTFCVQRVNEARREIKKIEAQLTDHAEDETAKKAAKQRMDLVMRSLKTACEQACPTQAITFGDLNWRFADGKRHQVVADREQPHNYEVLADLNTKPRTTYLTRLRNPNPTMAAAPATAPAAHG